MSFSSEVKEEISKINNFSNKECVIAEIIGYLISANSSLSENNEITFITENEFNIERFYKLLFNINIDYEPERKGKLYVANLKQNDEIVNELFSRIDINKENVQKALIRGAFLRCWIFE